MSHTPTRKVLRQSLLHIRSPEVSNTLCLRSPTIDPANGATWKITMTPHKRLLHLVTHTKPQVVSSSGSLMVRYVADSTRKPEMN